MLIDDSVIQTEIDKMIADSIPGFNCGKIDWIAQIKNVSAVIVRAYPPVYPPPQSGRIWVDTAGWRAYMATGTTYITDRSILWVLGWALSPGGVAVGNTSWNLVTYTWFGYDNATWIFSAPIADLATELRVGHQKVVGARQAAIADASGWLTVDTEARAALNDLLAKLRTHGIIAT
jgi:hypothetical protein